MELVVLAKAEYEIGYDTANQTYPTFVLGKEYYRGQRVWDPTPGFNGNYEMMWNDWYSGADNYAPGEYIANYGNVHAWTKVGTHQFMPLTVSTNAPMSVYNTWNSIEGKDAPGGQRVYSIQDGHDYEALVDIVAAENTLDPYAAVLSPNQEIARRWYDLGPSNAFACLDSETTARTLYEGNITCHVLTTGHSNRLVIAGLHNCASASVSVNKGPAETIDLSFDECTDFSAASLLKRSVFSYAHADMINPRYDITLTRSDTTLNLQVGLICAGFGDELGCTLADVEVGRQDYSLSERNAYGEVRFVKRGAAPRFRATVQFPKSCGDYVNRVITDYGSTPAIWNFNAKDESSPGRYSRLIVHGWAEDAYTTISSNPLVDQLVVTVEGLVE